MGDCDELLKKKVEYRGTSSLFTRTKKWWKLDFEKRKFAEIQKII